MNVSTPVIKMAATTSRLDATLALRMALDRKNAGRQLASLREQQRLTQENVRDRSGLSLRTVQRYELGEAAPRYGNLDAIAGVLGNEVYGIFAESPEDGEAPHLVGSMSSTEVRELREQMAAIEKDVADIKKMLRELTGQAQGKKATRRGRPPGPQIRTQSTE